ncbi:MAG: SUMF1/EgtB/PvdO family nonheme iron enzyme [Gammaproteobacteria bacterium]
MSEDLATRLRSLTRDYHDGRLNLAAYRSMRAALLDSLVANGTVASAAAAVAVTQPRAGGWQHSDAITRPGKPRGASGVPDALSAPGALPALPVPTATSASGSYRAPQSSDAPTLPLRAIVITVVVLAIAGAGVWLWLGRSSSGAAASSAAPTASEQNRIHGRLTQFTERGDWSDAHLAALNTDLLELGGASLSESSSAPWFLRFVDELRQRLKEQQALASTPLSANNSPLAALAVTMGLDLNAPDAAIHIAALPPPRPPQIAATPSARNGKTSNTSEAASISHGVDGEVTSPAVPPAASTAVGNDADSRSGAASPMSAGANVGAAAGAGASANLNADTHEGACRAELAGSRRPFCRDRLPAGSEGPPLALIPAGTFDMGGTAAPEEQPVHRVSIRAPFAISIYEVSQSEFKEFCEHTGRACPSQPWSGDDYPVVDVSWDDARAYTNWLSSVTHQHYSLPSEAQWEYAARAGRTGLFPSGDALSPTDANYSMLAKQTSAARRGQKFNANAFRLFHTVGNVREWVEDAWAPGFTGAPSDGTAATAPQSARRVARGGSYADGAARLRLSMREGLPAGTRDATTGFRIVRELP